MEIDEELLEDISKHSNKFLLKKYNKLTKKKIYEIVKKYNIERVKLSFSWYTDGVNNIQVWEDEDIPTWYYAGRVGCISGTSGKVWITNGAETLYIDKNDCIPDGYYRGSSNKSTSGYKTFNDGVNNIVVSTDELNTIDLSKYNVGRLKSTNNNYKKAASKRSKISITDGIENKKILANDIIPDGWYEGKTVLSNKDRIKLRDIEYEHSGYIAVKNLTRKQLSAYEYFRDSGYNLDVIRKQDVYTYINVKHLNMFDEYSKTNHSKGTSAKEQEVVNFIKSVCSDEVMTNTKSVLKDIDDSSFRKSRFKQDEIELLRHCSKKNIMVVGGFEKLISHCNYTELVSYVDRSMFNGSSYDKLGATLISITPPSYYYFKTSNSYRENRIKYQKHKLKDILEEFDSSKTEFENMSNNGYLRVYDCGTLKYKISLQN